MTIVETTKVTCRECKRETTHNILNEHKKSGYEEADGIHWMVKHQIVQCAGCGDISFVKHVEDSEDYDPETGEPVPIVHLYPDRAHLREPVAGFDMLPWSTHGIYTEVLKSLNARTPILSSIGLRAVIESVCKESGAAGKDLKERIDDLVTKGLLAKSQADLLHSLRFLGNHAAHEITAPKPKELVAALDIAETLLKNLFVLPRIAKEITTGQPH